MSAQRSASSSPERRLVAGLALVLLFTSCSAEPFGDPAATRIPSASPTPTRTQRPRVERPADEPIKDATIVFRVRNERGIGLSDVPILLRREGTKRTERLTTGARGILRIERRPAVYLLTIPAGCTARREINRGRKLDRFAVIEGREHNINLRVEGKRRYVAGSPIVSEPSAPWPAEKPVSVSFLVYDRCKGRNAPNRSIDDQVWRTSDNIEVADGGRMRSDGDARATVTVRCTASGDASVWLQDRDDARDRVDLLALGHPSPFEPDVQWCA